MHLSKVKQIRIAFAIVMTFFFVPQSKFAEASSYYETCIAEADYFVIGLARDCRGKSDAGTFKFNKGSLSSCYIRNESYNISQVFGSKPRKREVILSIPFENFTNIQEAVKGNVTIEITAPIKNLEQYHCGSQRLEALIAYDLSVAEKEKIYPVSISEDVFKLPLLPRKASPHAMIENGEWYVRPISINTAAQGEYDTYYQKKGKDGIRYRVKCLNWNNECHGDVTGILDGRYNYKVSFSKQHIQYLSDIIDGTDALLSISYEDN